MASKEYFIIEKEFLGDSRLFPFNLYIFNPIIKKFALFLYGNSPLTLEKKEILMFILQRGGALAISRRQKRTFLNHMELKEEDIPTLKNEKENELNTHNGDGIRENIKISKLNSESEDSKKEVFTLSSEIEKCLSEDNYMSLISLAREEIILFPQTISHTVSLATYLAKNVLVSDNLNNRICAVSYFIAKNADIKSTSALGDLVCAALFHHLGHTQLDHTYVVSNQIELNENDRKSYRKHAGLTQHILKKCKVDLSDRCIQIILQHHERFDGRGYPNSKMGASIEPLALILGAISHIFEYSSGRITGAPCTLKSVIHNLKSKNFVPGLEFEFGATIYDSLSYLINTEKQSKVS